MNASNSRKTISVVIPVFNAQDSLQELLMRLHVTLKNQLPASEVICIDDSSQDTSWEVLLGLKAKYPNFLRIARLQKNCGQHNAILCGFSLAEGDVVITMDDDLQNPPEEIPKLILAIDKGFDLAIGSYSSKKHGSLRNASGGVVDRVIRSIFGMPKDFQLTSFRAARRHVILNVRDMGGAYPYVTTMLLSHASRYTNVDVRHDPRKHGSSNYNFKRSASLACNLLLSYSSLPVKFVGIACLAAFAFSAIFGTLVMIRALVDGSSVQGWASTIVILSFFNAIVLMCLFIFSIYLSRFNQQLTRSKTSFTIAELHDV
jgi:glycosyltransferase involved in cell wall biosynthesis